MVEEEIRELIVKHMQTGTYQDSLEIGSPSKGGSIKIYCDFSDEEGTRARIKKALEARKYAQEIPETGNEK